MLFLVLSSGALKSEFPNVVFLKKVIIVFVFELSSVGWGNPNFEILVS